METGIPVLGYPISALLTHLASNLQGERRDLGFHARLVSDAGIVSDSTSAAGVRVPLLAHQGHPQPAVVSCLPGSRHTHASFISGARIGFHGGQSSVDCRHWPGSRNARCRPFPWFSLASLFSDWKSPNSLRHSLHNTADCVRHPLARVVPPQASRRLDVLGFSRAGNRFQL